MKDIFEVIGAGIGDRKWFNTKSGNKLSTVKLEAIFASKFGISILVGCKNGATSCSYFGGPLLFNKKSEISKPEKKSPEEVKKYFKKKLNCWIGDEVYYCVYPDYKIKKGRVKFMSAMLNKDGLSVYLSIYGERRGIAIERGFKSERTCERAIRKEVPRRILMSIRKK